MMNSGSMMQGEVPSSSSSSSSAPQTKHSRAEASQNTSSQLQVLGSIPINLADHPTRRPSKSRNRPSKRKPLPPPTPTPRRSLSPRGSLVSYVRSRSPAVMRSAPTLGTYMDITCSSMGEDYSGTVPSKSTTRSLHLHAARRTENTHKDMWKESEPHLNRSRASLCTRAMILLLCLLRRLVYSLEDLRSVLKSRIPGAPQHSTLASPSMSAIGSATLSLTCKWHPRQRSWRVHRSPLSLTGIRRHHPLHLRGLVWPRIQ